jgi:hypothetical protein
MDGHGRFLHSFLVAVSEAHGKNRLDALHIELVDTDSGVVDYHKTLYRCKAVTHKVCNILEADASRDTLVYLNFCGTAGQWPSIKAFLRTHYVCDVMLSCTLLRGAKKAVPKNLKPIQRFVRPCTKLDSERKNFITYEFPAITTATAAASSQKDAEEEEEDEEEEESGESEEADSKTVLLPLPLLPLPLPTSDSLKSKPHYQSSHLPLSTSLSQSVKPHDSLLPLHSPLYLPDSSLLPPPPLELAPIPTPLKQRLEQKHAYEQSVDVKSSPARAMPPVPASRGLSSRSAAAGSGAALAALPYAPASGSGSGSHAGASKELALEQLSACNTLQALRDFKAKHIPTSRVGIQTGGPHKRTLQDLKDLLEKEVNDLLT